MDPETEEAVELSEDEALKKMADSLFSTISQLLIPAVQGEEAQDALTALSNGAREAIEKYIRCAAEIGAIAPKAKCRCLRKIIKNFVEPEMSIADVQQSLENLIAKLKVPPATKMCNKCNKKINGCSLISICCPKCALELNEEEEQEKRNKSRPEICDACSEDIKGSNFKASVCQKCYGRAICVAPEKEVSDKSQSAAKICDGCSEEVKGRHFDACMCQKCYVQAVRTTRDRKVPDNSLTIAEICEACSEEVKGRHFNAFMCQKCYTHSVTARTNQAPEKSQSATGICDSCSKEVEGQHFKASVCQTCFFLATYLAGEKECPSEWEFMEETEADRNNFRPNQIQYNGSQGLTEERVALDPATKKSLQNMMDLGFLSKPCLDKLLRAEKVDVREVLDAILKAYEGGKIEKLPN